MAPDVVVFHMAEIQLGSLCVEAVLEKLGLELEEVAVAGVAAVAEDDVLVPCSVEPTLSWHSEDCLLPFQQIP